MRTFQQIKYFFIKNENGEEGEINLEEEIQA